MLAGEMMLGGLLIGDGTVELGAVEQRTIERAAQITALLTLKQDAVLHAEDHVRGELLGDLVSPDVRRRASLPARLRARRLRPEDLRTVVITVVAPEQRRAALRAPRQWPRHPAWRASGRCRHARRTGERPAARGDHRP
ncbi:hypothetical protein TPA0910_86330 [Streptomyces hygroscopicus subsp. sporocinereus]|uniref:Uncharacterized protein n=1 Tax=Streptomyces hygroscopicus TaxID=1912 RepID=A0ABQ3UF24_STRHY|nr:hypothetical protein [Streptomyces hygroscopicus]GHJ34200.1 hypothetical protein TPA0910_86330 [Streptomyces hygroscopicus]